MNEIGSTCLRSATIYSVFSFLFLILTFSTNLVMADFFVQGKSPNEVSIMAYNVENLFDAIDDKSKQEDPSYLPMSVKRRWRTNKCDSKSGYYREFCETLDWTKSKYHAKLKSIAKVLISYEGGADIVVLEELENKRVITDLWRRHLIWYGYNAPIHFESPSSRGIDVGIISKLPLVDKPKAYPVNLSKVTDHATRDIVVATFDIGKNKKLRVAANHWPSQGNSVETRLVAAKVLKKIAVKSKKDKIPFVATGDFNSIVDDDPSPIDNNLTDNRLDSLKRPMVDVQDYLGVDSYFPRGTHFYRGDLSWNFLDRFLVSKDLFKKSSKVKILIHSYQVFAPRFLFTEEDLEDPDTGKIKRFIVPHRFDPTTKEGYSDHLPIALKVKVLK